MPPATTKAERTASILAANKGRHDEWSRLHAIVCMDHGWDAESCVELMKMFDGVALAARMDELNAEIRAQMEAKTK